MSDDNSWSTERIAEQWRKEIRERFEAENAAWIARERAGVAKLEDSGEDMSWYEECDSYLWELFTECRFEMECSNGARIVMPIGSAIDCRFLDLVKGTSVAWSLPCIHAVIIDGEARVTVDTMLVDYHDDERAAEWERQHPKKVPIDVLAEGEP